MFRHHGAFHSVRRLERQFAAAASKGRLAGKVALITGGGGGIGAESSRLFANEGASVVVADLNEEAADRVAQEIRDGGGNAVSVGGNVANADHMKRMVGTAKGLPACPCMARQAAASSLDVVIGGGSLAGLSAAIVLLRAGHNVQLYERSPTQDRSHRGAGIVLQRHVLEFFRLAGLAPPDAMSVRCERRQYLDQEGHVTRKEDYTQRMTSWSVLYKALKDAFPQDRYHSGSPVSGFSQDQNRVEVQLAGGASVACDLFVAADGPRSVVRHQLLPHVERRYAGYVAWRGVVRERDLPPEVASTLVGRFTFFHGPGTQILSYLIPGPGGSLEPGERDMNWVWYWNYPTDAALAALLTDVAGQRHEDAIPADKLRPAVWEEQKARAHAHLPPQFARLVAMTEQPFVQSITDLAVPAMAHGRTALVGEAAFIPRPHTAAAADQAFSNSLGLAEAMASTAPPEVPDALRRWESAQMQYGEYLQELGQRLGNRSQFGDHHQVLDLSKLKKPGEAG